MRRIKVMLPADGEDNRIITGFMLDDTYCLTVEHEEETSITVFPIKHLRDDYYYQSEIAVLSIYADKLITIDEITEMNTLDFLLYVAKHGNDIA